MVCASCSEPVERTFDDEWQHAATDAGLACTAWPVSAVMEQARSRFTELSGMAGDENWLGI